MPGVDGPIALVLAPTRELAEQTFREARKFAKPLGMAAVPIFGGGGKWEMAKALRDGCELVVATPGRLIEMVKSGATNLRRCTSVVLDEADRMFEMGFEYQMRSIVDQAREDARGDARAPERERAPRESPPPPRPAVASAQVRPDRQTMLFSATFARRVSGLAADVLSAPFRVVVGALGQANDDVLQVATVVPSDAHKWPWLVQRLDAFARAGKLLIFVASKASVARRARAGERVVASSAPRL